MEILNLIGVDYEVTNVICIWRPASGLGTEPEESRSFVFFFFEPLPVPFDFCPYVCASLCCYYFVFFLCILLPSLRTEQVVLFHAQLSQRCH